MEKIKVTRKTTESEMNVTLDATAMVMPWE